MNAALGFYVSKWIFGYNMTFICNFDCTKAKIIVFPYSVCMIFFNYYVNFGSVSLLQWTKIGKNSAINDEIIGAVSTFMYIIK